MTDGIIGGSLSFLRYYGATRAQPEGSVGPTVLPTRTLLFMYHITVARLLGLNSRKSGWPFLLKSAAPTRVHPPGIVGPDTVPIRSLLRRYQMRVPPVLALYSR